MYIADDFSWNLWNIFREDERPYESHVNFDTTMQPKVKTSECVVLPRVHLHPLSVRLKNDKSDPTIAF